MKKALSLLLALVMCLSLCSCGSSENKDEVPQKVEVVTTEATVGTTETTAGMLEAETTGNTATDHPMLPYLYGEWEHEVYEGIKCSFNTIVINDNGTCVIDGMNATWEIDPDNTNYEHNILWVYFYDGSNRLGGVVLSESSFDEEGYSFSTLEPEGWMSSAIWVKKS